MSGSPHLGTDERDLVSRLVDVVRRYLLVMIAIVVVLAILGALQWI